MFVWKNKKNTRLSIYNPEREREYVCGWVVVVYGTYVRTCVYMYLFVYTCVLSGPVCYYEFL